MSERQVLGSAFPHSMTRNLSAGIRSSWLRCLVEHNLDPQNVREPHVLTSSELRDVTTSLEDLIAVASPELQRLFDRLAGRGYLVSIGSAYGVNLMHRCEYDLRGAMESFGIVPGAIWTEQHQGTNGIGTCLQVKRAISVVTSDHFDGKLKTFTCTDAPVFGPGGQIECVINTTTDRRTNHDVQRLVRDIVVRSARRIENTYFVKMRPSARILRIANHIDFVDLAAEARLALDDDDRIIDATSAVSEILTIGRADLLGRSFYEIFAADRHLENYRTPKALGPGLSRKPRVYALFEARASAPAAVVRASVANRPSGDIHPQHFADVFVRHPTLAVRIPAARRLLFAGAPILLTGEPGAGKEAIARLLFEDSMYDHFAAVRCSADGNRALSRLLSSPQFEGLVYIEDVEQLDPQMQHQLFWRLFGNRAPNQVSRESETTPFAVIASSTALETQWLESSGLDRRLFDAFGGVMIAVPPLRAYPDIATVIETVFQRESRRINRTDPGLSPKAKEALTTRLWTGNLGELERVARYACALCDGERIELHHLSQVLGDGEALSHDDASAPAPEAAVLNAALRHNDWNVAKTARYLGVSRATLYRRLNNAGISRPAKPSFSSADSPPAPA